MSEHLPDTNVGNIEYIRKEDAIDAVNHALDRETILFSFVRKVAISALKKLPSADVVRVVRCKDCENWQTDWNPSIPDRHYCAVMDSMTKADDFCSYGERKE